MHGDLQIGRNCSVNSKYHKVTNNFVNKEDHTIPMLFVDIWKPLGGSL